MRSSDIIVNGNEVIIKKPKSKKLSPREKIEKQLEDYCIKNYVINDDLTVDVNGNVEIGDIFDVIPFKFGVIKGDFKINTMFNKFKSLENCPDTVEGSFFMSYTGVTSLEGGPKHVKGSYVASYSNITTLKGLARKISGNFACEYNSITDYNEYKYILFSEITGSIYTEITELDDLFNEYKFNGNNKADMLYALQQLKEISKQ